MIDALLEARTREEFLSAVRALDRILLSGFYVVPLFYVEDQWLAYDSSLKRPDRIPLLGTSVEAWWRQAR
jgi:peptide/nickel transport system substrate-binding protein